MNNFAKDVERAGFEINKEVNECPICNENIDIITSGSTLLNGDDLGNMYDPACGEVYETLALVHLACGNANGWVWD